ncbi:MAG: hypothetical protein ACYC0M_14700, partial [Burkholderiales bacterium]
TAGNTQGQVVTVTNYDANGHPLSFVGPDGVVTTLDYSPRGWLRSKTVGNAVTRYRHDAAGQLIQVMNPDGSTVAYVHDAAHRLTDIADGVGNRVHFTLDAAGGRTGQILYNSRGKVVSGRSAVFDTLLESDDDGYSGSGEPSSVGLPDPSAQAQQHLARQLTQILRNLRDRMCGNGDCPPCKTVSGKIVALGTIGYRFDPVPPGRPHKPYPGDHFNLYKAHQYPAPKCDCFWQPIGATDGANRHSPPSGAIPVEPFANY